MPSLAEGDVRHQTRVDRADVQIVGLHAVEVGGAVDQPGAVQRNAIAQHGTGEEANLQRAAHEVVGQHHWHHEAADGHHNKVVSEEGRGKWCQISCDL